MEDLTGRELGPYRVVAPLGDGGMARVYQAFQPAVNRYIALKVLPRQFSADPQFLQRFQREANLVARLQHPHIVPVFDFGESDGYAFLVMPLIRGGTLASLLRLPLTETVRVIRQVAEALDYAHANGVTHRDIKPSNILIDEWGNCLLADFGIARMAESATTLTQAGSLLGTPAYMSPEQAKGEAVGSASDIYSLGIVLYEMLTGRVPFQAETPVAIALQHVSAPLPRPGRFNPALTPALEAVVLKALARRPTDRFASAGALAQALSAAVEATKAALIPDPVVPPGPVLLLEAVPTKPSWRWWLPAVAIGIPVVAVATSTIYLDFATARLPTVRSPSPPPSPPPTAAPPPTGGLAKESNPLNGLAAPANGTAARTSVAAAPAPSRVSTEFVSLVEGQFPDAWVYSDLAGVRVADHTLFVSERAGWVRTDTWVRNFSVRFEARALGAAHAVFAVFGMTPRDGRPSTALIFPLLGANLDSGVIGRDLDATPVDIDQTAVQNALNANADWQSYEITRTGTTFTVRLNGAVIAQERARIMGWLGVRVVGGEVALRNVAIAQDAINSHPGQPSLKFPGAVTSGVALWPRLEHIEPAALPALAQQAHVRGIVTVDIVVETDGTVKRANIRNSIDGNEYGVDDVVLDAARKSRFFPATKDGEPVAVETAIEYFFMRP